jgi:hypothetical protein
MGSERIFFTKTFVAHGEGPDQNEPDLSVSDVCSASRTGSSNPRFEWGHWKKPLEKPTVGGGATEAVKERPTTERRSMAGHRGSKGGRATLLRQLQRQLRRFFQAYHPVRRFQYRFFQKSRLPFFYHEATQIFRCRAGVEFMCNILVHDQRFVEGFAALEPGSIAVAAPAPNFEKLGVLQPGRIDSHLL